jgi:hypothetical protein
MEGKWLREAGFETGVRAKVLVMPGWLLVEAIPIPEPVVVAEPKRRRSWAHDNPNVRPVDLYSKELAPLEARRPLVGGLAEPALPWGKRGHGSSK